MKSTNIGDLLLEHFVPTELLYSIPFLFIHGMYEGAWVFRNWAQVATESGREVWVLNLRGHHGSRPVENFGKVSLIDYVQDVEDVLKHIGSAILIGHSMGGLIAQIVADRNPSLPGLVLANSAAPRGVFPGTWRTMLRFSKPRYVIANLLSKLLSPHKGDIMSLVLNNVSLNEREEMFPQLVPEAGRAVRDTTFWPFLGRKLKIDCPTLVVGAKKDRLTPVRIQKAIARIYNSTYIEFPGAHALPLEKEWGETIKFILNWAADHAI